MLRVCADRLQRAGGSDEGGGASGFENVVKPSLHISPVPFHQPFRALSSRTRIMLVFSGRLLVCPFRHLQDLLDVEVDTFQNDFLLVPQTREDERALAVEKTYVGKINRDARAGSRLQIGANLLQQFRVADAQ
jgi:hypothetical protein